MPEDNFQVLNGRYPSIKRAVRGLQTMGFKPTEDDQRRWLRVQQGRMFEATLTLKGASLEGKRPVVIQVARTDPQKGD